MTRADRILAAADALKGEACCCDHAETRAELASLRALVRAYAEAHEARIAHSTQVVRDEHWYAERDDLNNAVSDALTALRKAAK